MSDQPDLFGPAPMPHPRADADDEARRFASDPRQNAVLEASAGTGKTTVLVQRYLRLLGAGVDPANILAITFTRKAAAEMRERIVGELRADAERHPEGRRRWLQLRDRLAEIAIGTIDAFCLSLLREFPLEADLEPGFDMADETEVPRLIEQALDRALRICLARAREDGDLALLLARLGVARARVGLAHLLDRRLVARNVLQRYLARGPADLTVEAACRAAAEHVTDALRSLPMPVETWIASGPVAHPKFQLLAVTLRALDALPQGGEPAAIRVAMERVRDHFLTRDGQPRGGRGSIPPYAVRHSVSAEGWRRHRQAMSTVAPAMGAALARLDRDLNVALARGLRRMYQVAEVQYTRELEARSLLDFPALVDRALGLLRRMDEFSQSRFRLESRYHHVLVDELQDTSRAQWELVALLVQSWGEGFGLVHDAALADRELRSGGLALGVRRPDHRVSSHAGEPDVGHGHRGEPRLPGWLLS